MIKCTSILLLAGCAAFAQSNVPNRQGQQRAPGTPASMQGAPPSDPQNQQPRKGPPPEEKSEVTHHKGRVGGQQISYTATVGTYVIKSDDGTPKATFFYVSYTKDEVADLTHRPLSFVYNGGPGSGSLFTHMGLGPRRPMLLDDGSGLAAPYTTEENEDSLLDFTDMVFIDAISTGYSRPAPGETPSQFYGLVNDATWFSDFIYQFLVRNDRWASPKFLIGESYGTTRSAELSYVLQQRHQIYLSGVALLSSVGFGNWGADDRSKYWLPTYIVSAWYHKLLAPDLQKLTIDQIAQQARHFAHNEYAQALEKGDELTPADYQQIVKQMSRYTGLSTKYIEESNLRVSPQRWFKELERDKRRTIGRLDSRFEGMDVDAAGERVEYDASEASYEGAYSATFQDYVRRDLHWKTDMFYTITANVRPWDQGQPGQPAEALRSAMTEQTHLKLLVIAGYYDLATPFNGIEQTVSHMNLEPSVRKNVSFAYYEAGHMMYIDKKCRQKLHKDLAAWVEASYRHDNKTTSSR